MRIVRFGRFDGLGTAMALRVEEGFKSQIVRFEAVRTRERESERVFPG